MLLIAQTYTWQSVLADTLHVCPLTPRDVGHQPHCRLFGTRYEVQCTGEGGYMVPSHYNYTIRKNKRMQVIMYCNYIVVYCMKR